MKAMRQIHNSFELLDFVLSLIKTSIEEENYERTKELLQEMIDDCRGFIITIGAYESVTERERYLSRIYKQYTRKRGKE